MIQNKQASSSSRSSSPDPQLWQTLETFNVDESGTQLSFVGRLAEENHWPLHYAERVFGEYKRFLYLAVAAEHPASPSDAVDQAWHLHLAYTRSYWDELCGKVLKRPLHHLPTTGGRSEDEKHSDLYRRTLESYERFFGQPAPSDIWPRGNAPEKFARIRTSDFWMVRKPSAAFRKRSFAFAAIIALSSTMAACSAGSVGLFPMLFIGAIVAAIIYAYRNKLGNGGNCSSSCSGSSCSSGSGFFSFFSSCSSDSGGSDSGSSDSGSGGDSSSCSSSSCSSCSSSD